VVGRKRRRGRSAGSEDWKAELVLRCHPSIFHLWSLHPLIGGEEILHEPVGKPVTIQSALGCPGFWAGL